MSCHAETSTSSFSLEKSSESGDFVGLVSIPTDDSLENGEFKCGPIRKDMPRFSWKKMWAFMGPGFLMSIAYLDPGNIESDLQSGAVAKFQLLWVLLLATIMGLLIQTMSSKIGTVTGKNLAEQCYSNYKRVPRLIIWVMMEIALIGSDMQEVIGTCIAINLLSGGKIPLWAGVLITASDVFVFMFLDQYGIRKVEGFFGFLLLVMAVTFGYEYVLAKPDQSELFFGIFVPHCYNCGVPQLMQAVGTLGAVVMPHNMYLHSALVRSRCLDRDKPYRIREANFYYMLESSLALILSFIINVFVVSVLAQTFFGVTNNELRETCSDAMNIPNAAGAFPSNNEPANVDLYYAGLMLGCTFGAAAYYIWAIGLLAAGQSSTMTGTYAGQFVMQGFLNIKWSRTKRILFTRGITLLPTLFLALSKDITAMTGLNDLLNILQSIQLPFALIPTLQLTIMHRVMGEFRNKRKWNSIGFILTVVVLGVNMYFVIAYIFSYDNIYLSVFGTLTFVVYMGFIAYLCISLVLGLTHKIDDKTYSKICCIKSTDEFIEDQRTPTEISAPTVF